MSQAIAAITDARVLSPVIASMGHYPRRIGKNAPQTGAPSIKFTLDLVPHQFPEGLHTDAKHLGGFHGSDPPASDEFDKRLCGDFLAAFLSTFLAAFLVEFLADLSHLPSHHILTSL
ncbi:MAG: hypothetical protein J6O18_05240 [Bacilli bacterium]|nr:hypothetical protein [Bacilli bacterium]